MKQERGLVPVTTVLLYSKNDAMRSLRLMNHAMVEIRLQFQRLNEEIRPHLEQLDRHTAGELDEKMHPVNQSKLFADLHFLLVALKRLKLSFEKGVLESSVGNEPEIVKLKKKHFALLREINHFRNCLEHIEKEATAGNPDLGQINLRSRIFIFKGRELDFGPKLEMAVEAFYKAVDAAVIGILDRRKVPEEDRVATGIIKVP